MRSVLFVGAGRHQRRAIRRARELGLRVVGVDRNPDALGLREADVAETVDFQDVAGVTAVAVTAAVALVPSDSSGPVGLAGAVAALAEPDVLLHFKVTTRHAAGGVETAETWQTPDGRRMHTIYGNGLESVYDQRARIYENYTPERNDVIVQVFTEPQGAGTTAREQAIVQASIDLTRAPGAFGADQVRPLRAAGLSDLEILDAVHAVAIFAWANRLMLNLGEPVLPG